MCAILVRVTAAGGRRVHACAFASLVMAALCDALAVDVEKQYFPLVISLS